MHWLVGMALPLANWWSMGWPGSSLGMVGSVEKLRPPWPYFGVGAGVDPGAVVGVDDVAGGAAAGAVVAGVVVGAEEVERRVEQARLLQAENDGVGAVLGAEAADAEAGKDRPAGVLARRSGMPISGAELAAALEDAEDVARLA